MEQLYTIKETAKILHRTEKTVKKYIGNGLTVIELPGGYLVPESNLIEFLQKYRFPCID